MSAGHRQLTDTQTLSDLPDTHAFTYQYDSDAYLTRHTRPRSEKPGKKPKKLRPVWNRATIHP